ncbi:hypothetical protein [Nitrososphaera sp.]|uniref:hypothetical protein n=1 Tax=Nitrososphaera sp. TaxID=1971748 RepID=UPI00307EA4C1
MVTFSALMEEFRSNVAQNRDALAAIAKKSPHAAYQKVNELALFVGGRHGVNLQLHFPVPAKVTDVDSYGTENIGLVVDKFRRTFPIPREQVKGKAAEMLQPGAQAQDAYMYEGKEGVKVILPDGKGRLEILPGSIHLWCKVDDPVRKYADWLMENVYLCRPTSS